MRNSWVLLLAVALLPWAAVAVDEAPADTPAEKSAVEAEAVPAPQRVPTGARQIVYLDENGNRVSRPAGAKVQAPAVQRGDSKTVKSAGGGVGMRNPNLSYTYARKSADGVVNVHCVSVNRDDAENGAVALNSHACSEACSHAATTSTTTEKE